MSIPIYEPINSLKQVDENVWIVDGGKIKMSILSSIGIPFSTRMTIIRLKDQSLWIHSPIKADDKLLNEINQLGEVKHLISPNKIHYAYIQEWKTLYPEAIAWSSPGVEKRASSQKIEVSFDAALEDIAPQAWSEEIEQLIFKGSRVIEEVVFFHKSSQTLILTDLIENFEANRTSNIFWKTIYKIAGIADPDGKTPIDMRMTFTGNKNQARESYQKMLAWQPDKVILAHGRWYSENGTTELKRAFRWLEK